MASTFVGTWIVGDSSKALTYTLKNRTTGTPVDWTSAVSLKFEYRRTGTSGSSEWTEATASASATPSDGTLTVFPGTIAGMAPASTGAQRYEFRFKGTDQNSIVWFGPDDGADALDVTT